MAKIPSEYAPIKMDEDLERLCALLVPNTAPVLVSIRPWGYALPGECFTNVERYAERYGGHRLLGWRLLRWANIMVECEAHAVWESPDGELLDVTPYTQSESLFLHDPSMNQLFGSYHRHSPNSSAQIPDAREADMKNHA